MYDPDYMTQAEYTTMAVKDYAICHGRIDTERAWISTPYDTWEPNPFYSGPDVPHPDDECWDED